jgi:uncharacterized protein
VGPTVALNLTSIEPASIRDSGYPLRIRIAADLRAARLSGNFPTRVSAMRCPICKQPADMTPANRFRPFCSERCQMVDLGKWAGEDYRVPGAAVEDRQHPDDLKKKLLN